MELVFFLLRQRGMALGGHPTHMARLLGPKGVMNWAWRRTQRTWFEKRYERGPLWTEERLCAVLGMSSEEAATFCRSSLTEGAPTSWARRHSVVRAVDSIPHAQETAFREADEAAARLFEVFGTRVEFGRFQPVDWSLDPISKTRYPFLPARELSVSISGMDPKYPWQLGRLDALLSLAQGAWLSNSDHERQPYLEALKDLVNDFLSANPPGLGIQWTSAMEVALRAANLAQALHMTKDFPVMQEPFFVLRLMVALLNHGEFVVTHLEDAVGIPNNHLIANELGLFLIGLLFPNLPSAHLWQARGLRGLEAQMQAQVHEDGVCFEGSVPYHRLVLEMFTLAYVHGCAQGMIFGRSFTTRLEKMFRFVEAYCSEEGLAPQIGDNDSGRVFPWAKRASLEHDYLLGLGAALFQEAKLKRPTTSFPLEAAWLLGMEGFEAFQKLPAEAKSASFTSWLGGIHVLKNDGVTLTLAAGDAGQKGVGGHSHNHKLSFELHLHGEPVVVDPGSPTYTRHALHRNAYRSTSMHNTLEVDGLEQAPLTSHRLFALPDVARAYLQSCQEDETGARWAACLDGLVAQGETLDVERRFDYRTATHTLQVLDALKGQLAHELVFRLHLPSEECRLRAPTLQERRRALLAGWSNPVNPRVVEWGGEGPRKVVLLLEPLWTLGVHPYSYSPGYGEWREACVIELRAKLKLPVKVAVLFLFGEELNPLVVA